MRKRKSDVLGLIAKKQKKFYESVAKGMDDFMKEETKTPKKKKTSALKGGKWK